MEKDLYREISKRKSFHIFGTSERKATEGELKDLSSFIDSAEHLDSEIKVDIEVVEASECKNNRGNDYAVLFYSEKKGNYLGNVGYIGEQIDLYLAKKGFGALWFGIGRPVKNTSKNGLPFIIMIIFSKKEESEFRKDVYSSKRKDLSLTWEGKSYPWTNLLRFAPSACNTQNWFVLSKEGLLSIYREKATSRGIMPKGKVTFYNRIDLGIFLCFLELSLLNEGTSFKRTLFLDEGNEEKTLFAEYRI